MQPAPKIHVSSVLQLVLSGLGLVGCLLGAGSVFLLGATTIVTGTMEFRSQAVSLLAMGWTLIFFSLAALPSIWYALRRLNGRSSQPARISGQYRSASLAMLLWPLVLALGAVVSSRDDLGWAVLPPLQVLAVIIPLWWVIEFSRRNLPRFTSQRSWGVLNFAIFFSTPVIIGVELLGAVVGILLLVMLLSGMPDLRQALDAAASQLGTLESDPGAGLSALQPFLDNPWVIFSALVVLSGLVPLIEEALKPLAVWALRGGRRLTPAEGFAAGALAGAGFALVETLFSLVTPSGNSWLVLVIGRAGTGLLHITNTALMGWALAEALAHSNYLRLGVTYFVVAGLHGLWNAFSLLLAYSQLLPEHSGLIGMFRAIGAFAPYGMASLAAVFLVVLWLANRRLVGPQPMNTPPDIEV